MKTAVRRTASVQLAVTLQILTNFKAVEIGSDVAFLVERLVDCRLSFHAVRGRLRNGLVTFTDFFALSGSLTGILKRRSDECTYKDKKQ